MPSLPEPPPVTGLPDPLAGMRLGPMIALNANLVKKTYQLLHLGVIPLDFTLIKCRESGEHRLGGHQ